MYEKDECCQTPECCPNPEQLKGKPQDCSPEQIKKCHGDTEKHPCAPDAGTTKK
jgi:hypothetical protein